MGQTVKLRRSAVSGKKPNNSQLELGELSVNTTDGKLFFAKSGSSGPSVEEIITTNAKNTGSIEISGSITATILSGSFTGDGSGLTSIPASAVTGLSLDTIANGSSTASIDANGLHVNVDTTITGSLTATEFTGSGLGLTNVPFRASGSSADETLYDGQFTKFHFDESTGIKIEGDSSTGIAKIYLSGVAAEGSSTEGRTAILEVTSASSTWTLNHGLGERYPAITVFDSDGNVIIPQNIESVSTTQLVVSFASPQTGVVTATVGGGLPSISSSYDGRVLAVNSNGTAAEWKEGILSSSISFNTYTSSIDGIISSIENTTSSFDGRLDLLELESGSIRTIFNSYTASNTLVNSRQDDRLNEIEIFTASIDDTYATDADVTALRGTLNSYTSSNDNTNSIQNGRLNSLETESGSIRTTFNSYTSSNNATNNTQNGRLSSLETKSGSLEGRIGSLETISSSHDGRLDSLESTSGSHNTRIGSLETFETKVDGGLEFTGSNVTIKGNLLVKGTETRVNSTTVDLSDNIISLNGSGAANAGIEVRDNTSPGLLSGSLLWDGTNNYWVGGAKGNEERLLVDSDLTTLDGRLDSIESKTGSFLTSANLGTLEGKVSSLEVESGSIRTTFNSYTSSNNGRLNSIENSTSSLNSFTSSIASTIKSKLSTENVHSGSYLGSATTTNLPEGNNLYYTDGRADARVSLKTGANLDLSSKTTTELTEGTNLYYTDARVKTKLNSEGVVSGSIQVNITGTTGYNLVDGRLDSIESFTGSLDATFATDDELNTLRGDFNSYTSSNDTTNTTQNGRLTSLESKTGSFITGYTETQTLQDVTDLGSSTTNGITAAGLNTTTTISVGGTNVVDSNRRIYGTGTASNTTPAFTFAGDTDTGLSRIGADSVGLIAGASRKFYVSGTNAFFQNLTGGLQLSDVPLTVNSDATITGSTLAGSFRKIGGVSTEFLKADGSVDTNTYLTAHPSVTAPASSNNSGRTYIQDILLDSFGHITGLTTATETVVNTDEYTTGVTFNTSDGVLTFTRNDGDTYTIDIDGRYSLSSHTHDDRYYTETEIGNFFSGTTSISGYNKTNWDTAYGWGDHGVEGYLTAHPTVSAASSSNNSGRTYIQDILLDSFGHITGITTATETVTDTNYYTTGVTWNGTTATLTFTRNNGGTYNVQMLETLSDVTVTGGTYNSGTQTLRLTKSDGSTVDVSGFAVDTDTNWYTTGATFNTADGVLTLVGKGMSDVTVDLDGRYLTSHPSVSAASSSNNSGRTYIQDILLDSFGHITGITTATETVVNSDTITRVGTSGNEVTGTVTLAQGGATTINQVGNTITISSANTTYTAGGGIDLNGTVFSHADTSSQASSNNSGRTYIQDILLDTYGHITGITTATETVVNTDTNYYTTGATFNTGDGVITFTRNNGGTYTVDIDGRYLNDTGGKVTGTVYIEDGDLIMDSSSVNGTGNRKIRFTEDVDSGAGYQGGYIYYNADNNYFDIGTHEASDYNTANDIYHIRMTRGTGNVIVSGTLTAGSFIKSGGTSSQFLKADGSVDSNTYLTAHPSVSAASSSNNSGRTYIQDILLDSFGHITGITTATETVVNSDTITRVGTSGNEVTGTVTLAGSGATSVNQVGNTITISSTNTTYTAGGGLTLSGTQFSHADTSATSSSNNSGRTYIQDILLDTYGHITGITTATETVVNTDTNYYTTGATWTAGTATLTFTRNDGGSYNVQMLETLSDVTVTGGTYNSGTQTLRLTKSDGSTVDVSGFAVDTDVNWYTTGATFNTGNGVITGTLNNGSTWTVDIDGKYLDATSAAIHSQLYVTGGDADTYTRFGIYRNYAVNGPIGGHNTILHVAQYDGNYGFQLGADTTSTADGLYYRSKDTTIGTWKQVASRSWVTSQNYLTAHPSVSAASSSNNSGRTYIQDILLDSFGHITGITTATETVTNTDTNYYTTGATFSTSTGVITGTRNDGGTWTVDIDGRYLTAHPSVSAASSSNNSGRTYIQDILLDSFGHITGITTATETVVNSDTITRVGISGSETTGTVTLVPGGAIDITQVGSNVTITHADTSSQGSSNNSGRTYIQDVLLDGYGHVTGLTTATETVTNTDTNYYTTGATFSTSTGVITFTRNNGGTYTVDIDGKYAELGHNHDTDYLPMSYTDVDMDSYDTNKNLLLGRNVGSWSSGTKPAGSHNGFGVLQVTTHDSGYATQLGFDTNQNTMWVRSANPSTWGTWSRLWSDSNDGSGSGLDADLLDGQQGSYYLNYNNFSNTPTIGNGTLTVQGTGALSGSGTFTANQTGNATITISHADTSAQGSVNNSGRTYIQDILLDTYGHITGITSATETVTDTNYYTTGTTFNSGTGILTFTRNDGGTYTANLLSTLSDVTVTGGTYNSGTQTLRLTKSDGSTVDVSGFAVDTDVNWYTTGATFNTGNGIITGTHQGGTWTVDIDGRYLPLAGGTLTGNLTVGATNRTSDTVVQSLADQGYKAGFEAYGNGQGTGYLYVGQSADYGGGISYNGDGSPAFVNGETADYITFYRREAGTNTEVFAFPYSNNNVYFNGEVHAGGGNSTQWNSAYTYSTVGHLPLAGGTLTGNLVLNSVNPEIQFNGTSDTGVDMAIKATPEGLDFYEPEDGDKIHFQILDDTGVNAAFGLQVGGTSVISSSRVLENVSGNISMFTNDSGYLTTYTDTNYYTTGATWNSGNGVITFTRNDGGTYTVDIDGRYLLSSGTAVDSDKLDGYQLAGSTSVGSVIFNNKGQNHSTVTDFNTVMTPGANFIQGGSNGPTGTASHQWYGLMLGLGADYGTSTGTSGHYANQLYWARQAQGGGSYLWARDMEGGTWGSWRKMSAGYADSSGVASSVNVGSTTGTWITSSVMSDAIGWNASYGVYIGSNVGGTHYLRGNGTFTTGGSTYTLWHSGNDGSGSGLDADTVDGIQGSSIITTSNIGSQAVDYASRAKWIDFPDGPRDLSDRRPNWNNRSVAWDFVTASTVGGSGNYAGVMTFSPWDGTTSSTGDSSYQLAFYNITGVNASGIPGMRLRNGIDTTWNSWYTVWHAGNDGSGSGLDSDLLDGQHGSYYTNAGNLTGTIGDVFSPNTRYNIGLIDGNGTQTRDKIRVWDSSSYTIGMKNGYTYGWLGIGTDGYAMSFQMSNTTGRGFWWGDDAHNDAQGAMSLTVDGKLTVATSLSVGEGESITAPSSTTLYVKGNTQYATVFDVQGTQGQLFSITDDLTGDIFKVSDISGIPILNVNSSGTVTIDETLNVYGDVTAYYSSDERLKDNVTPITNAIDKMKLIGGYEFDWNENSKHEGHDVGVIAQEIEKVLPEVVTTRSNGYKAVKYEKLTALLIQANKELIQKVEELERKLK